MANRYVPALHITSLGARGAFYRCDWERSESAIKQFIKSWVPAALARSCWGFFFKSLFFMSESTKKPKTCVAEKGCRVWTSVIHVGGTEGQREQTEELQQEHGE